MQDRQTHLASIKFETPILDSNQTSHHLLSLPSLRTSQTSVLLPWEAQLQVRFIDCLAQIVELSEQRSPDLFLLLDLKLQGDQLIERVGS